MILDALLCFKLGRQLKNNFSEAGFFRIRLRTFSFWTLAIFLEEIATSSHDHSIRLRILHRYSRTDFYSDQNPSLGVRKNSANPPSSTFLSNRLHILYHLGVNQRLGALAHYLGD